MSSCFVRFILYSSLAGMAWAQDSPTRNNFELSAAGLFPLSGYRTNDYSAGVALRTGYALRAMRYLSVDAGWTGGWPPGSSCSKFGCTHPVEEIKLLDYGLRGVLPLAGDRVELSVGLGGGYIWFARSSENFYANAALLQYSGQATVAIDRQKHFRVGFTMRTWRDLGRPTQQWLSTALGVTYGFGRVK